MQYKLLVYVSQKQHITTAKIDASFGYTVSLNWQVKNVSRKQTRLQEEMKLYTVSFN